MHVDIFEGTDLVATLSVQLVDGAKSGCGRPQRRSLPRVVHSYAEDGRDSGKYCSVGSIGEGVLDFVLQTVKAEETVNENLQYLNSEFDTDLVAMISG